jgi:Predicted outer membrane protein
MKLKQVLLSAAIGFALAQSAVAADLSRGDQKFLKKAAENGMLEIQASQLAAQKAQHPEVKKFAEMMIKDHTEADKELKALAQSKGVELPTELKGGKKRQLNKLNDLEGPKFDEEYADEIAVDAHKEAVDLFEDAADDAEDADVKAFAAKLLPALKQHLELGERLEEMLDDADDRRAAPPAVPGTGMGTTPTQPGTTPGSMGGGTTGGSTMSPQPGQKPAQ